jgi:hypothetical protein
MPGIPANLEEQLRTARRSVASAETVLDGLLNELEIATRAEKKLISHALRAALDELASARRALDALAPADD